MICTGPSVPENISVSETWSDEGYRYSPSSSPPPSPNGLPVHLSLSPQWFVNIPWEFGTHLYYRVGRGTVTLELCPETQHSDPSDLERHKANASFKQIDWSKQEEKDSPPQKENNSQNQRASNGQTYEQQTEQPSKNVCLLSYSVLTLKMSTSSAVLPLNLRAYHRRKHYLFTACLL